MPPTSSLQHLPPPPPFIRGDNQPNTPFYPSLHLYPLNDSFVPKQISLAPQNGKVKIGRQTNAKTVPGERNGYFDSKVLSRQHAEIWEEGGKIFIRDVKSSNGTFINGERLSPEGVESESFELKTDDTVEFGIDIVGEDNKTIIHHKVAAKVIVVLTPEDLANVPLHPQMPNRRAPTGGQMQPGSIQNNALGGMGGAPRTGKSGLTFDHILGRLQAELAKSRETGNELNQLTGAMSDIQETLGGALPPTLPQYPAVLPAVRPPPADHPAPQAAPPTDPSTLTTIQSQLVDTQSTLQQHLDKIRHLESYVNEQEALKREVTLMKDQMEERKKEVEILLMQRRREYEEEQRFSRQRNNHRHIDDDDDDDDARSVATAVPERDTMDEEEGDDERRRRREELGRPRTPEPTGHLADEEYEEERRAAEAAASQSQGSPYAQSDSSSPATLAVPSPNTPSTNGHVSSPSPADLSEIYSQNAHLANRLETLAAQLDSAMEISRILQSQALMAQSTIASLEAKVGSLEAFVQEQKEKTARPSTPPVTDAEPVEEQDQSPTANGDVPSSEPEPEPTVVKSVWEEWRSRVEGEWHTERETWATERGRLADAVKEWEKRTIELEKKEDERTQREEAAVASASNNDDQYEDSSSGEESEGHDAFQDDTRVPAMVNGFSPKPKKSSKGRRRKSHGNSNGHANGMPNGVTTLPSPMSSPTSSAVYYASHTRRSTSPSSEEHRSTDQSHSMLNGKLPLSPPNTSPRSRAESLAAPINDDDESENSVGDVKEAEDHSSSLHLSNGGTQPSAKVEEIPNAFIGSAHAFAQRNGLGSGGPSFRQQFGEIVSYLSSSLSVSLAYLIMPVAMGLSLWTITDALLLIFIDASPDSSTTIWPLSSFVSELVVPFLLNSDELLTPPPSGRPRPSSTSLASLIPGARTLKCIQPLPYLSAASMVIIGVAAWAM
ncbi:hypothetical protein FRB99_001074, partial [Tulasnella sp. 403]